MTILLRRSSGEYFGKIFDVKVILGLDFERFFGFCQDLGYFGYRPEGYAGRLQSPAEVVRHQVGNCWDETELQRAWFEQRGWKVQTFLLYYYLTDDFCPSHSILVFRDREKWYWFEPMFCGTAVEYSGVHEYDTREDLLRDFRRVFMQNGQKSGMLPKALKDEEWVLCQYERPKHGITGREFYEWCRRGELKGFWH